MKRFWWSLLWLAALGMTAPVWYTATSLMSAFSSAAHLPSNATTAMVSPTVVEEPDWL